MRNLPESIYTSVVSRYNIHIAFVNDIISDCDGIYSDILSGYITLPILDEHYDLIYIYIYKFGKLSILIFRM